jgi:flavin-dependent dehydrogenase
VGDAAAAFDPISGSGVCFALRSALEAAEALDAAKRGANALLGAYQRGVQRVFAEHLLRRRAIYRSESRWDAAPFWAQVAREAAGQPMPPERDGPTRAALG